MPANVATPARRRRVTTTQPGTDVAEVGAPPERQAQRYSLLIADSDATFRAGLLAVLENETLFVVGEAADKASAVGAAARLRPSLCLLDASLPGGGLSAVAAIARRSPTTTIVVLTDFPASAGLLETLERGASGYLPRKIGSATLAKALAAACRGEPALSRRMVASLAAQLRRQQPRRLELGDSRVELTGREWDVAEHLLDGLTTLEMADRLALSPVTVRRHVGSLLQKLGAPDRATAVQLLRLAGRPSA